MLTKTLAQANAAKTALQSGQSWDAVAKKYSTDPTTKNNGGLLTERHQGPAGRGARPRGVRGAANKIRRSGQGSVRLLRVRSDKDHPGQAASLAQSTPLIRQTLTTQLQTAARPRSTPRQEELVHARPRAARTTRWLTAPATRRRRAPPVVRPAAPLEQRAPPRRAPTPESSRALPSGAGRRRSSGWTHHPPAAAGVPVGPRAGRAHDRPPHGRGGVRARRRRAAPRRREAAGRARRCAVPGSLPVAAARGARSRALAEVAEQVTEKLIRRHPHVFGEAEAEMPARSCATGTRSSAMSRGASRGCSARSPRTCPRRCTPARSSGAPRRADSTSRASRRPLQRSRTSWTSWRRRATPTSASTSSATCCSRPSMWPASSKLDPELALRAASERFRARVAAAASWRHQKARSWNDLRPEEQSRTTPAPA